MSAERTGGTGGTGGKKYKSALQEWAQKNKHSLPKYRVTETDDGWKAQVEVVGRKFSFTQIGGRKKQAEEGVAERAYSMITQFEPLAETPKIFINPLKTTQSTCVVLDLSARQVCKQFTDEVVCANVDIVAMQPEGTTLSSGHEYIEIVPSKIPERFLSELAIKLTTICMKYDRVAVVCNRKKAIFLIETLQEAFHDIEIQRCTSLGEIVKFLKNEKN